MDSSKNLPPTPAGPEASRPESGTDLKNLVRDLQAQNRELQHQNEALQQANAVLTRRVAELESSQPTCGENERQQLRFQGHLLDAVGQAVIATDLDGTITYWNDAAEKMYGWPAAAVLGRDIIEVLPARTSRQQAVEIMARLSAGESWSGEFPVQRRDGTVFPALVTDVPLQDEAGNLVGVVGVSVDLTGQKQTETALRESEERYRRLVEISPDSIILTDLAGRILVCNAQTAESYGCQAPEMLLGRNAFEFIVPEDRARARENLEKALAGEPVKKVAYRMVRQDGSQFIGELNTQLVRDAADRPQAFIGIIRDITERKQAEAQLVASEARYRLLFEQAHDAIHLADENDQIVDVNRRACELFGYSREELLKMTVADLQAPEVQGSLGSIVNREVARHGNQTFETVDVHREGRRIPVEISVARLPGTDGPLYMSIVRDITWRKKADEELRQSYEERRVLLDLVPVAITITDETGQIIDANRMSEELLGITVVEQTRRRYDGPQWQIIRPDGSPMPAEEYASVRAMQEQRIIRNVEMGVVRPDGQVTWISVSAAPIPLEGYGVAIAYADITGRKRAEETLQESERILNVTGKMGRIGGWEHDLTTGKAVWTQALYDIIDLPYHQEPPGVKEHLAYYPSHSRKILEQAYNQTVKTGIPFDLELPVYTAKRRLIWCRARGEPVFEKGQCVAMRGTFQDITERKQAEEQLKQALAEKTTLLQELYHRTKNNMMVIHSMLALRASYVQDEHLLTVLEEVQDRIQAMALVHQKLYESSSLSSIDLKEYIDELAEYLLMSYRMHPNKISLELETEPVSVLIDTAIPCGLILSELISNTLKHAFPGDRAGRLSIQLHQAEDEAITLRVADNGVGVTEDFDMRKQDTRGVADGAGHC
jgi:PAS domain S-box-containing protein